MRTPIRLKNLRPRFLPAYAVGAALLWLSGPSPLGFSLGLPLVVVGAALRTWGAGHLVKTDRLCTEGPYAHLRHPLYAGTLLIGAGFSLFLSGWLGIAILTLIAIWFTVLYFPRKEKVESIRLERLYGEAYRTYRAAVPALLPRWRAWRPGGDTGPGERWRGERFLDNNELGTWIALVAGVALVAWRAAFLP